jgi:hypothetical protein
MTQFILTVEGDHAKLTANGLVVYESHIGTKPPVTPDPSPVPIPVQPPPLDDPCEGLDEPRFLRALAEGRELSTMDYVFRMKPLSDQERACLVSRGIPRQPKPSAPSVDKTGFILASKGVALRNRMAGGNPYKFTVPNTQPGERVTIQIGENGSTNDGDSTSEVRGPSGELLSGPSKFPKHFGEHVVISPGGSLSFYLTPEVDTSLSVIRM